jgi:hypothetical protein
MGTHEQNQRFVAKHPTYYRDAQRKWRAEHKEQVKAQRKKLYQEYKDFVQLQRIGKVCAECGETQPDKLDFHHVDPATKKFAIARTASRSKAAILAEIAKCIVLCHSCHTAHHNRQC